MRTLAIGILAALMAATVGGGASSAQEEAACQGPPGSVRLYVRVDGVRAAKGLMAYTVYGDNPKKFLAPKGSLYVGRVPAKTPSTTACLNLPKSGVYAIAVYHDINGNRKIDKSSIGLPTEATGLSNDPPTLFGLPSFGSVRFVVPPQGITIRIPLRYSRKAGKQG